MRSKWWQAWHRERVLPRGEIGIAIRPCRECKAPIGVLWTQRDGSAPPKSCQEHQ